MPKAIDLTNKKFGLYLVLKREGYLGKATAWVCRCECGKVKRIRGGDLRDKKVLSCGCYHSRELSRRMITHGQTKTIRYELLMNAKSRAKEKGLPFNLTIETIPSVPTHCPYLGIELHCGDKKQNQHSPSLDRIEPQLGYVHGNVQIISYRANAMKGTASFKEFEKMYLAWKASRQPGD